jgi:hypothetical protein
MKSAKTREGEEGQKGPRGARDAIGGRVLRWPAAVIPKRRRDLRELVRCPWPPGRPPGGEAGSLRLWTFSRTGGTDDCA